MAGDLIATYLAQLGAELPDSPAASRALAEVEDGLRSATEDHVLRGVAPDQAAELAVAEFGDPGVVAAEFVPLLAAAAAHRNGLALLATGPLIGAPWLAAAVMTWRAAPAAVAAGLVVAGLTLVAAIPRVAYGVVTTGRLGHRLPGSPAAAVRAVTGAARTAVALDVLLVLVALPALALLSGSLLVAALTGTAATFSLGRLMATRCIIRRLEMSFPARL